jgi:FKBP-type peptidyl-prolyl cis-trans isomerase FkpA
MKKAYLASAVLSTVLLTACGSDSTSSNEDQSSSGQGGVQVGSQQQSSVDLNNDVQKSSYSLGASLAFFALNRLEQQDTLGLGSDQAALIAGFEDAFADSTQLSKIEIQQIAQAADKALGEAQAIKSSAEADANIALGQAFLAENAEKEGVNVTASGLQYEIIEEGSGSKPLASDTVTVHYRGTLLDGREFDSSYSRGEPTSFPLNGVIPGWTEGVQLMNQGAKYRFYIPANLAYGARSTGMITPNSALIFDIELLNIEK